MTTTAEQARDAALIAVGTAHPTALQRALDVIRAWAAKGRPFNANDTRPDMRAANVPTPVIGRAFMDAARLGIVEHGGYVRSTDRRTHNKPVSVWRAPGCGPRLDQPRDDRGRYDAPIPAGQMTLEEAS